MAWLHGAWAVFMKDARLELRTRTALSALGLFVAASLILVRLALGREPVTIPVAAALLWVVILFAAATGLGRAFVAEEEGGTTLLLRLTLPPLAVYAGKLLFNASLTLALTLITAFGFVVLVPTSIGAPGLFTLTLALGAVGLACGTTLLSALIARARAAGPLLPVLAFPVLIPLLLPAVELTQTAMLAPDGLWTIAQEDLILLIAFSGLTASASVLLFEFVWRD